MNNDDRRRNPRFFVGLPAHLKAGEESIPGRLRDVCRDAAFVEADRWLPLQSEVTVSMDLPGTDGPVEVKGKVIRLAPGDLGRHGMAVLFDDVTPAVGVFIDLYVSQRES